MSRFLKDSRRQPMIEVPSSSSIFLKNEPSLLVAGEPKNAEMVALEAAPDVSVPLSTEPLLERSVETSPGAQDAIQSGQLDIVESGVIPDEDAFRSEPISE